MATTKNITMKQFNGTDYDTLYPKTIASQVDGVYNKTEILTAATAALYGLPNTAVPDEVFALLQSIVYDTKAAVAKRGNCKIALSSYTGTGTYGETNPTRVSFSQMPLFFIIKGRHSFVLGTYARGMVGYNNTYGSFVANELTFTWSGNQVSFSDSDATRQMNVNDQLYEVIAFYAMDAA